MIYIKDKQFRSFTEGVTTLRLQEFVRRSEEKLSVPDSFSTEAIFGKLNLNFLLENALRESVSPFAKKLLEEARVRSGGTSRVIAGLKRGDDTSLPIYETYLEMRTKRAPPAEDEPAWSKRRVTSQLTRKAMVGAYLSIMTELRTAPRYAYADMILQLSDSCIRDFLNNLDYIYQASHRSLPSFLSAIPVKATTQNVGLLGASKAKFKSLPTRGVNHPSSTAKLITGLAKLTQLLQSQSKDGVRHLKTTERGIFDLAIAADTDITARAVTLIIGAAEAGFLKTLTGSKLILAFRVHTSLAPAYGFSYRGAYYHVPIQASDILSFADALDDREIEKLVALLFDRIDGNRSDLFSEADYD